MPCIDLAFRLTRSNIPVDHGYVLYAALSRIVPELHAAKAIGVQPIRGLYNGSGQLQLSDSSRLVLRLPDGELRPYLKLAGKSLEVDDHRLIVGVPEVCSLLPVACLRARLVTIKGFLEKEAFLQAVQRQLRSLGLACQVRLGQRRTFRVKEKQVVGFEVAATGLTAEDSIRLQETGLGGRRKMGCGVFVPLGGLSG